MSRTIAVARPGLDETQKKMIRSAAAEAGYEVVFVPQNTLSGAAFPEAADILLSAEIIYGEGADVSAAVRTSDNLKWFCASFAGVDEFCRPGAFKNEQAILTNSAGAYGVSLAEHAIMLALMIMRRMPEFYDGISERKWLEPLPHSGIKDAHVTLLGTGDAGRCLARRLKAFEPASITGVCRSGRSSEEAFDTVVGTDRLEEVLAETDLLIISLPGTPETYHMLNDEMFAAIKPGAFLVNVGRGSVIDEQALIKALHRGRHAHGERADGECMDDRHVEERHAGSWLAGAALDVLETEPPQPDSPLWNTPGLLLTPHIAGNLTMDYTRRRNTEMFCGDLLRYAKGEPLLHEVDRRKGY